MNSRFLFFFSVTFLSIFFSCIKEKEDDYPYLEHEIEVGDVVPVFTVYEKQNGSGEVFQSAACKGKVTLLVFFNTGCKDCQRELPKVNYVYEQLKNEPLYQIVAIARDQAEGEVSSYWKEADNNFTMPVYVDPGRKVFTLFANQIVPRVYIVNPDGVVTWMAIEYVPIEKEGLLQIMRNVK